MTELRPRPPIATVRPSTSIPSRIVTLVAVLVPPLGVLSAMGLLWEVAVRPVDVIMLVALYIAVRRSGSRSASTASSPTALQGAPAGPRGARDPRVA